MIEIGFHTDAFNSSYWSFDQCLDWGRRNGLKYIECGATDAFTYITNVTSSNPQVVRVEWALSKQWSVVALREENGVFGIDFYFKKRF